LRLLFERADHCFKWGLFDRDPLPTWGKGFITLLGDAAHPMLPFLGQGAAMAFEDAYVLSRELGRSPDDVARALRAYEAERIPRTAQVQLAARKQAEVFHLTSPLSRIRRWLQNYVAVSDRGRLTELRTEWLYSYDATCCTGAA
jgi:salicylate hydroxylase